MDGMNEGNGSDIGAEGAGMKPGRVNGKNSSYKAKRRHIRPKLRLELIEIMRENLTRGATKDKKVGGETAEKRKEVILTFFGDLLYLKYDLRSIYDLKQKHLEAVFKFLEAQGQSPATLQNKISIMRIFCEWMGKHGMVTDSSRYVANPFSTKRSMVATEDKSWEGNGVNLMEKIELIRKEDERSAGVLLLCYGFGLRIREAVMMNVFKSDDDRVLMVVNGTKGGRARHVPIEHEWQRNLLDDVKGIVDQVSGKLIMRGVTTENWIRRVYYLMKKHDLTLADSGVSAHGLRHQYMHERFEEQLGIPAPVKGGDISLIDKKEFDDATARLMERAGHSRPTIGASYYGSRRMNKVK